MPKCRICPANVDSVGDLCPTCIRFGYVAVNSQECDNCSRTAVSGYTLCKFCYQNLLQQRLLAQRQQALVVQQQRQQQIFVNPQRQVFVVQQQKKCKHCNLPASVGHALCNGCYRKRKFAIQNKQVFAVQGGFVAQGNHCGIVFQQNRPVVFQGRQGFVVQHRQDDDDDDDDDFVGFYHRPRMYM